MPALTNFESAAELISRGVGAVVDGVETTLAKRVKIPVNGTTSPAQITESQEDPWGKSAKYGLGWVYFSLILLLITTTVRCYHLWGDKIRRALFKEEVVAMSKVRSPESEYELASAMTDSSTRHFFPSNGSLPQRPKENSQVSTIAPINNTIALFRWIFYRPIPVLKLWKLQIVFPSLAVTVIVTIATAFVVLYCFLPRPLFYTSIAFGSPPVAIRAGMLSVAMMPWLVALGMKANIVTLLTGIGHERLNVLHRWGGYICLLLALIHMVPFYTQSSSDSAGFAAFKTYFTQQWYIFTTGIAAMVPLLFLCVHSLPILRTWAYEIFVTLHVPVSVIFIGMLFWHCNNALTSWNYLYATLVIWFVCLVSRVFYLNWTNPWRLSWLIGEESAVTILPENAVKVTIPTQKKWRPGQYVYLRMPGISLFENHPFTISSLCAEEFPSQYGEQYRDMTLVFRPFGGFTRTVYNTAMEKGPFKTYRSFIDGPYGGMQREMAAFDTVVFFAGGSGITAIASQLLELIKRMREGKAVTKRVQVVWAMKRPEMMEWFKEELRICREYAPPDSVDCQFFITASKRYEEPEVQQGARPNSGLFHEKLNDVFQNVSDKRSSALIREEAEGDEEREKQLRKENEDGITALPRAYLAPPRGSEVRGHSPSRLSIGGNPLEATNKAFDFGFPETPTMFQKSLMRFAFLPAQRKEGWRTEYGRPDVPYMLKDFSRDFGRRTCVFVCGPPSLRVDCANTVAKLQLEVLTNSDKDEIFLHAENYAV